MKMKDYLTAIPYPLGGGMDIQRKPDPVREYTPEETERKERAAFMAAENAFLKRQRKARLRQAQQQRIDAALWWRNVPGDKQWKLMRKYWPEVTWPDRFLMSIESIVHMFKQETI